MGKQLDGQMFIELFLLTIQPRKWYHDKNTFFQKGIRS